MKEKYTIDCGNLELLEIVRGIVGLLYINNIMTKTQFDTFRKELRSVEDKNKKNLKRKVRQC